MTTKITTLLGRYAHLAPPDLAIRESAAKLFSQEGVDVPIAKISFKNKILFVSASPLIKNELLLKKEQFLAAFAKELGEKAPRDIR